METPRSGKRGRGRPPLPEDEKRKASMGFRPTPDIRRRLEKAAAGNRRSMSREIEHRLEGSFVRSDATLEALGGADNAVFILLVRVILDTLRTVFGMGEVLSSPTALRELTEALKGFFATLEKEAPVLIARGRGSGVGRVVGQGAAELFMRFAEHYARAAEGFDLDNLSLADTEAIAERVRRFLEGKE